MTLRKPKYSHLSYDDLAEIVNETYRRTGDLEATMKETELSFSEVYELVGFKDAEDFGL